LRAPTTGWIRSWVANSCTAGADGSSWRSSAPATAPPRRSVNWRAERLDIDAGRLGRRRRFELVAALLRQVAHAGFDLGPAHGDAGGRVGTTLVGDEGLDAVEDRVAGG